MARAFPLRAAPTRLPTHSLCPSDMTDYADAFTVTLPAGIAVHPATAATQVFDNRPRWVDVLLGLRDLLVRPFGLRTGRDLRKEGSVLRIGLFTLLAQGPDAVLLGEDDRHLNARVLVAVEPLTAGTRVTLATYVHFNNWLGRAYFAVARPFHCVVVPAMLGRAAQRLACRVP